MWFLGGWSFSYERGTPLVHFMNVPAHLRLVTRVRWGSQFARTCPGDAVQGYEIQHIYTISQAPAASGCALRLCAAAHLRLVHSMNSELVVQEYLAHKTVYRGTSLKRNYTVRLRSPAHLRLVHYCCHGRVAKAYDYCQLRQLSWPWNNLVPGP